MSHSRFALGFTRNRKVRRFSDAAFRLWVSAIDYAREQLTDGFLDEVDIDSIPGVPPRGPKRNSVIAELVGARGFEVIEGGWIVHDFHHWQDTAEEANAKRTEARDRMRRVRANKKGGGGRGSGGGSVERSPPRSRERSDEHLENESGTFATGSQVVRSGSGSGGKREEIRDPDGKTTTTDLSGSARAGEAGGGGDRPIPCPIDLKLTEKQRSTLSVQPEVPDWAIDELTREFVASNAAAESDFRTLEAWRKCLSVMICRVWSNADRRPKKPGEPGANGPLRGETPDEWRRRRLRERAKCLDSEERGRGLLALPEARS